MCLADIMQGAIRRQCHLRLERRPDLLEMGRWLVMARIDHLLREAEQLAAADGRRRLTEQDVQQTLRIHDTEENRQAFLGLKFGSPSEDKRNREVEVEINETVLEGEQSTTENDQ